MKTWTNSVKLDYRPSQFHWEGIYKENMKKNTWKITINDMSRVSTEVLSASRIWRRDSVRICQNNIGYEYLLIPFLWEWTSIYQLFWCSPRVQGFDTQYVLGHVSPLNESSRQPLIFCLCYYSQCRILVLSCPQERTGKEKNYPLVI